MTDSSNGVTWVLSSKIEATFRKVRDIQEFVRQYVLAHDKMPVSVEDTQWAIEEKYTLKIIKELVDFESVHVRGMMERYADGHANVFVKETQDVDPKLNLFWHRFITVKEMMHLAIDEHEDWSSDGCDTIEDLIKDHAFEGMHIPRHEIQSEALAEVAAIELLYPMEFRIADIKNGTPKTELSAIYEVPLYVVDRALSESYMKLARLTWSEVGGHGLGGIGSNPVAE